MGTFKYIARLYFDIIQIHTSKITKYYNKQKIRERERERERERRLVMENSKNILPNRISPK